MIQYFCVARTVFKVDRKSLWSDKERFVNVKTAVIIIIIWRGFREPILFDSISTQTQHLFLFSMYLQQCSRTSPMLKCCFTS